MKAKTIKIVATAAVFVAALSGLMYTTLSEGTEYYKHVDEVMTDPVAWHGKRMSLHGFVVEKSIFAKPDTLEYRFEIQSNGKVIPARYLESSDPSRTLRGRLKGSWVARFRGVPNGVMDNVVEYKQGPRTPGV